MIPESLASPSVHRFTVDEVSLTSLDQDRGEKRMAYARGRIPVYWIINLVHRQVDVFADPGPDGYGTSTINREGQSVPVVIGGLLLGEIAVNDILPPLLPVPPAGGNGA